VAAGVKVTREARFTVPAGGLALTDLLAIVEENGIPVATAKIKVDHHAGFDQRDHSWSELVVAW
jgi:hypothetical protein